MQCWLDARELSVHTPTLAAALQAARHAAQALARVIVEVHVNDRPLTEDELDDPSHDPIPGAQVRFVSAEPRSLVRTTLLEMADVLIASDEPHQRAAEHFQRGQSKPAFAELQAVLSVWENARRAVHEGPALLGIDLAHVLVGDHPDADSDAPDPAPAPATPASRSAKAVPLPQRIDELNATLAQLKSAIEGEDWATVADVLGHDLRRAAAVWAGVLRDVAAHVAARR